MIPEQNTARKDYKVAALYHFVALHDFEQLKEPLLNFCKSREILGTLLLADEGINGTVAGSPEAIDELIIYLRMGNIFKGRLKNLDVKFSTASKAPFLRMRVKLKREIVTLRAPEASPTKQVGAYCTPEEWNEVISDPETLVIDTRNDYEVAIGSFERAVDPRTTAFTEFKDYVEKNLDPEKHKKVAMFCTGGIRCEKASSYMMAHGFNEVYHLKGGILKYLEEMPEEKSLWNGDCFVFDERVAVGHGLTESGFTQCHACRYPLNEEQRSSSDYIHGVQCPHCKDKKTDEERARAIARQKQMELAAEKGISHIGDKANEDAERMRKEKEAALARTRQQ